mmetsp:Transcript_21157/g.39339  ORF Transcript_21157/g.39339 Transcript_21157/m.39339 type:complete len:180 (-) Transcript_21157:1010-1549(-)
MVKLSDDGGGAVAIESLSDIVRARTCCEKLGKYALENGLAAESERFCLDRMEEDSDVMREMLLAWSCAACKTISVLKKWLGALERKSAMVLVSSTMHHCNKERRNVGCEPHVSKAWFKVSSRALGSVCAMRYGWLILKNDSHAAKSVVTPFVSSTSINTLMGSGLSTEPNMLKSGPTKM